MDESPFLFEPVPLRSRRDGWTPERQRAFIDLIRSGLKPGRAAARLGLRRQGAYELRARAGGESFAAAWDAAADAACNRRIATRSGQGLYARAVEGIARPVRYRRRVVGVERRCDNAALIRLIQMFDRKLGNPVNGDPGLFSPMDPELLSAFAPTETLWPEGAPPSSSRRPAAIGGGESHPHPLEDVDHMMFRSE
jgi:hypothetical protein